MGIAMLKKILFLVVSICLTVPVVAQDVLQGRLFTTPQERAQLDLLRQKERQHPAASADSADSTGTPEFEEATLDGYVTRSSGKNTAWINQTPHSEAEQVNSLKVVQMPGHVAQISMLTRDGRRVKVKVGDTLDRVTGKVRKIYDAPALPVSPP